MCIRDSYSAAASDVANVEETVFDTAGFIQDDIKITKKITLTAGYRIDALDANGENPAYEEYGYYNSAYQYVPLASPVYIPEGGSSATYTGYNNKRGINDQSFFASLSFKPTETSTLYFLSLIHI